MIASRKVGVSPSFNRIFIFTQLHAYADTRPLMKFMHRIFLFSQLTCKKLNSMLKATAARCQSDRVENRPVIN